MLWLNGGRKSQHQNHCVMSSLLDRDQINQLMGRPPFVEEDQTRSPVSFGVWSGSAFQDVWKINRHADLRMFLIHGTGATGASVAFPRQSVATSPRTFFLRGDFGTWIENGHLTLLLNEVLRIAQPQNTRESVSTIKFNFSLNISQLADVLRVSRPTVYSWFDEDAEVSVHPDHQSRIEQLTSYAEFWWEKAGRPLPKELLDSAIGSLLLDELKAEVPKRQLICPLIEGLFARLPAKRPLVIVKGVGPVPESESEDILID